VAGIEEIRGGGGIDVITGTASAARISGGLGNDRLSGGVGNDTFLVSGSSGADEISGGDGFDRILGSAANDRFSFASVAGNLSGIEVIDGGGGTDIIQLTAGDDTLDLSGIAVRGIASINLAGGNDTIVASNSNDILRGGAGADTFVFRSRFGQDTIADFQRGTAANPLVDVIDLSDANFVDFADVMSHAVQDGADTLITIDGPHSVRLTNITMSTLHADDFQLA
jgi:Ca2+-binding RTX toxin-like protein